MKMNQYHTKHEEIYKQIGSHAKIVLATSYQNKVSARKMSFIIQNNRFYFQTDKNMRKYYDIQHNPQVALCIDNIQIEGICHELGHPLDNPQFCQLFQQYFPSSFEAYTSLESECLFMITPTHIQRWNYIDHCPVIEQLIVDKKDYIETYYL